MPSRPWSPAPDAVIVGALLFARATDLLLSASEPERNAPARALIAVAFLLYLAYLLLDLAGAHPGRAPLLGWRWARVGDAGKLGVLLGLIGLTVLLPLAVLVARRARDGRHAHAHDGLVQVEEAARLLLRGANPYAASYRDTPMALVAGDTPALEHLAYLPALPLSAAPGIALVEPLLGWYDHRLAYALAFVVSLALLARLAGPGWPRLALLALAGLNPFMAGHLAFGLNDAAVLALVLVAVAALAADRPIIGGVAVGVAGAMKATAWPLAPFYALYLLGRARREAGVEGGRGVLARWARALAPAALTWLAIVLPFALRDPGAFVADVVGYVGGRSDPPVPAGGVGFSAIVLAALGPAANDFPYGVAQLLVLVPVLLYTLRRQGAGNTLRAMLTGYAITFLAVSFFAYWFYENYLGYALVLLALAAFWDPAREPETAPAEPSQPAPEYATATRAF